MMRVPGMEALWAALPEARVVGGAVRDMLVGCAIADVDFASPLSPDEVMARVKKAGLKAIPTGLAHGTVTVVAAGHGFEVTTLRRDVETDGRHARVVFTNNWQADAARRDFTFNAMSYAQTGEVFDYFGGRDDLAAGIVRFVGVPRQRIIEDYLRILRFFRFFARYGRSAPEEEVLKAICANKQGIMALSPERVWDELKKILSSPAPLRTVELMRETGVLELVLPGARLAGLAALVAKGAPADPLLRVASLTDEDLARRLRLSGAEAGALAAWRVPLELRPGDGDASLRRALATTPHEVLIAQSWLHGGDDEAWHGLRARLAALPCPVFPVQGRDLASLGIEPGPYMGQSLAVLRRWWLAGGCVADRVACLAWGQANLVRPNRLDGDAHAELNDPI